MTTYLSGGWYGPGPDKKLRTEVLDGAIDAAGILHRAGIVPEVLSVLALKVRSQVTLGAPMAMSGFDDGRRAHIARRLESIIGDSTTLQAFVADCLEHVGSTTDLMAFYLHLWHVTRMLQLYDIAKQSPTDGGLLMAAAKSVAATTKKAKPAKRKAKAKAAKVAKKKAAKKKAAKKKATRPAKKKAAAKKKRR